jgi:hypothetical protein
VRDFGFEFYPPIAWVPFSQEREKVLSKETLVPLVQIGSEGYRVGSPQPKEFAARFFGKLRKVPLGIVGNMERPIDSKFPSIAEEGSVAKTRLFIAPWSLARDIRNLESGSVSGSRCGCGTCQSPQYRGGPGLTARHAH